MIGCKHRLTVLLYTTESVREDSDDEKDIAIVTNHAQGFELWRVTSAVYGHVPGEQVSRGFMLTNGETKHIASLINANEVVQSVVILQRLD